MRNTLPPCLPSFAGIRAVYWSTGKKYSGCVALIMYNFLLLRKPRVSLDRKVRFFSIMTFLRILAKVMIWWNFWASIHNLFILSDWMSKWLKPVKVDIQDQPRSNVSNAGSTPAITIELNALQEEMTAFVVIKCIMRECIGRVSKPIAHLWSRKDFRTGNQNDGETLSRTRVDFLTLESWCYLCTLDNMFSQHWTFDHLDEDLGAREERGHSRLFVPACLDEHRGTRVHEPARCTALRSPSGTNSTSRLRASRSLLNETHSTRHSPRSNIRRAWWVSTNLNLEVFQISSYLLDITFRWHTCFIRKANPKGKFVFDFKWKRKFNLL